MLVLEHLKNSVIISVQAQKNEPFCDEAAILAMMKSVVDGGAEGLRLAGVRDVVNARKNFPKMPIIAITKPDIIPTNYKELVYITPSIEDVKALSNAGADIIAFDATLRGRKVSVEEMINEIHIQKKLAMADVSNFTEGQNAVNLGADLISTTLSGYTNNCKKTTDEPDFELLRELVEKTNCPIVLEGRIWTPEQIKKGFEMGAYCVVIGSAVTRPYEIVRRFIVKGKL